MNNIERRVKMAESSEARHNRPRASAATWVIAISLAVIAAWLTVELGTDALQADSSVSPATDDGGGSIFAVAGQITSDRYGVYLIDPKNRTICVYQWQQKARKLRLMSARNYTYDLQLDEYNTAPSPREIKSLVEQSKRLDAATKRP